jgi:hypothetical protein
VFFHCEFIHKCAPVAQLDRASGYEPEGRQFESVRAHHEINGLGKSAGKTFHQPFIN